jgi:hypothetical protein
MLLYSDSLGGGTLKLCMGNEVGAKAVSSAWLLQPRSCAFRCAVLRLIWQ